MTFRSLILARSQAVTYSNSRHKIHQNSNRTALCAVVSLGDGLSDLTPILLELLDPSA